MKESKTTKNQKRLKIIQTIIDSYCLTDEDLNNRDEMGALLIRLEADIALVTQNPRLLTLIIENNRKYGNRFKKEN